MATDRKSYFAVADSILRKGWPADLGWSLIMLMAFLHQRWSRDKIAHHLAGSACIHIGDLMVITAKRRADVARTLASRWPDVAEMSVEHRGDLTLIDWPKFAEFQKLGARSRGRGSPNRALSGEGDGEGDGENRKNRKKTPGSARKKPGSRKTDAPEELSDSDRAAVLSWLSDVMPRRVDGLDQWIEECLGWHRANGVARRDWAATVENWIRNGENRSREASGEQPLRSRAESTKVNRQAEEMRAQFALVPEGGAS